jgi:hypothetical protein
MKMRSTSHGPPKGPKRTWTGCYATLVKMGFLGFLHDPFASQVVEDEKKTSKEPLDRSSVPSYAGIIFYFFHQVDLRETWESWNRRELEFALIRTYIDLMSSVMIPLYY